MSPAPGYYCFRVGAFLVTTAHDGFFARPIEGFVRNAPLPEVQAALRETFLPTDRAVISFTITFVQRGDTLAVFDTGNGMTPAEATAGRMIANKAAAGIDPARVTRVIHSHIHGDHVNGLLNAEGSRAFPNAEVHVPAPEWAWWTDDANQTRSPEGQRGTFANVALRFAPYRDRVKTFQPGAKVIPGIISVAAFGHTPGHSVFRISDGNEQAMFLADVTNRPEITMAHPAWQIVFDIDGAAAAATRRRVLDLVATGRIRVTGYHYPFPANGYVARAGNGFRFVPADWSGAVCVPRLKPGRAGQCVCPPGPGREFMTCRSNAARPWPRPYSHRPRCCRRGLPRHRPPPTPARPSTASASAN